MRGLKDFEWKVLHHLVLGLVFFSSSFIAYPVYYYLFICCFLVDKTTKMHTQIKKVPFSTAKKGTFLHKVL